MIVSAVFFALLLGAAILLALPLGRAWQRVASVALFVMLVTMVYGGSIEVLGRAKPVRLEWRDLEQAEVLGSSMRENEVIYVWLQPRGETEPRLYALPWSMETAQGLQAAMEESEANGNGVEMMMSGQPGLDEREPMFYAPPQPALPDKSYVPLASRVE
jgi:hypothetical protein